MPTLLVRALRSAPVALAAVAALAACGVTDPAPEPSGDFGIELRFIDDDMFSDEQRRAFERAVDVWSRVVVDDLEDVHVEEPIRGVCGEPDLSFSGPADDLVVLVDAFESAPDGVLAIAGPCLTRSSGPDAGTNFLGYMSLDTEDLPRLEREGQLVQTIVHEMGHVLGIGTNWDFAPTFDLLHYEVSPSDYAYIECDEVGHRYHPTPDYTHVQFVSGPLFLGPSATRVYEEWFGGSEPGVPVEDIGGPGTQCGHWREATFGNELMTGYLDAGRNPLSLLTVMSLADIGYAVDPDAAEPYDPSAVTPAGDEPRLAIEERLIRPRSWP